MAAITPKVLYVFFITSEFKVKHATIYKKKIGKSKNPDDISLAVGFRIAGVRIAN